MFGFSTYPVLFFVSILTSTNVTEIILSGLDRQLLKCLKTQSWSKYNRRAKRRTPPWLSCRCQWGPCRSRRGSCWTLSEALWSDPGSPCPPAEDPSLACHFLDKQEESWKADTCSVSDQLCDGRTRHLVFAQVTKLSESVTQIQHLITFLLDIRPVICKTCFFFWMIVILNFNSKETADNSNNSIVDL